MQVRIDDEDEKECQPDTHPHTVLAREEQSFATKENHRGTETRRNMDMRPKTEENSGLLHLLLSFFLRLQSPLCLRVSVVRFL